MHDLTTPASTMTSREIAELVDSRHDSVKRAIERLAEKGAISQPPTVDGPKSPNGVVEKHYLIGKRDSYVIVAQLSPEFTARLVDRWQALEEQVRNPIAALSRVDLLKLALDSEEKRLALEHQVGVLAPKAAALDRIATETEGAVCLRVAAKLAQVPEKQFISFLSGEGWIFRHHHSHTWTGYSDKERAGLIELKKTRVQRDDGSEKTVEQVLVTPRGQAKAAELIERKAPWLHKLRRPDGPSVGAAA